MADLLRVHIEPTQVSVVPGGEPVTVTVRVYNATRIIDEFTVAAVGTGQWLNAEPKRLRLFPETEDTTELQLSIPAGRMVTAGSRTIGIEVRSATNAHVMAVKRMEVTVRAVAAGQSLELEPQIVRGGDSARLTAIVRNGGNMPLSVALRGDDPERAVAFRFSPPVLQVPPGGALAAAVDVSAKQAYTGAERQRQLTVHAEGGPAPLSAAATFLQGPLFTYGRVLLVRVLLTLVGAAALIGSAFLLWTAGAEPHTGLDLTYRNYVRLAFGADLARPETAISDDLFDRLTSIGVLPILLGVLALIGLARGWITRLAGGLGILLVLAFVVTIARGSGGVGIGVGAWIALLGSLVALLGGFAARIGAS